MKYSSTIALAIILASAFSCDKGGEETVPSNGPTITFESIRFGKGDPNKTAQDSVSFLIGITDLDMNFGMNTSDFKFQEDPYQTSFFVMKNSGELVSDRKTISKEITLDDVVMFSDREDSPYDTLPALSDCHYYPVLDPNAAGPAPKDWVFYIPNLKHYNVFITALVQESDGSFTDVSEIFGVCKTNLYGRAPDLSHDDRGKHFISYEMIGTIDISYEVFMNALTEGKIEISIITGHWKKLSGRSVKLSVFVTDLAFTHSNTIETSLLAIP